MEAVAEVAGTAAAGPVGSHRCRSAGTVIPSRASRRRHTNDRPITGRRTPDLKVCSKCNKKHTPGYCDRCNKVATAAVAGAQATAAAPNKYNDRGGASKRSRTQEDVGPPAVAAERTRAPTPACLHVSGGAPGILMDSAPEGTLRFQSEIVDPATDKGRSCTFFVDSGSSVNLTRSWCLAETKMHEQPLTVKALKDDLQVERCGR
jgi:hypothetical protein